MKKTYIQPSTFVAVINGNMATMQHASFSNTTNHYQAPASENDEDDFEAGAKNNNIWE